MERELRLTKREWFSQVYNRGKSAANHQFVLYYLRRPKLERFRVGISASKKLGGAVVRNRLRRMIKEIVRLNEERIETGYDLVIIIRKPAVDMTYAEMERSLMHVLKKASLLKNTKL
ncbi:ribonuclease P protein component [Paenibacillus thermoaerophilus]|uniref:Ribonuclease P protein component n=1 Tax=Paenibacillus thermoaerophilus TaxID=1215385 RepID=A0ABW2V498_9BACL|nr:ribonuclease P protein component [Paenibacillus thermoaerophilus]TMV06679.1 ribonuclease P protein component [Paenibacillus thermoaerophilus]